MVFLKEFFEKVDFEKNQQTTNKYEKFPSRQRVNEGNQVYTTQHIFLFSGLSYRKGLTLLDSTSDEPLLVPPLDIQVSGQQLEDQG